MLYAGCGQTASNISMSEFLKECFSERVIALNYPRLTDIGMDWLLIPWISIHVNFFVDLLQRHRLF